MIVIGQEYTRLIPSNPLPPLVAPTSSSTAAAYMPAVTKLIAAAGPWFNSYMTQKKVQEAWALNASNGLKEADKYGYRGVLLRFSVAEQQASAGTFYTVQGNGVELIGVGQDANAVCYSVRCDQKLLGFTMPSGSKLTANSGYYWIERAGGAVEISHFNGPELEDRASLARSVGDAAALYRKTVARDIMTAYSQNLERVATTRADKAEIKKLLDSREKALKEMDRIEKELDKELDNAKRAARTSATLNSIASAFNLAGAINMAVSQLPDLDTNGVASKADLLKKVQAFEQNSNVKVRDMTERQTIIRGQVQGVETVILEKGVMYDRPLRLP